MLLFITDYDPSTHANWCVGRELAEIATISLLGDDATRDQLMLSLAEQQNLPVFAMSHGSINALKAHNSTTAIDINDANQLANRTTFAWACHTATELGLAVSAAGGTWWGYTGAITAPEEEEHVQGIFREIFRFISEIFSRYQSEEDIIIAIDAIKQRCERAAEQIDLLVDQIDDIDIFAVHSCLLQIWDRLRVWRPQAEIPNQHTESKSPILYGIS